MKKKFIAILCLLGTLAFATACNFGINQESSSNNSLQSEESISDSSDSQEVEHTDVWGEPTYAWDGNVCTATRDCVDEECSATETETVTGTYVKDTDASCTVNEKGHYEATFENEAFAPQTTEANSVEVPETAQHTEETIYVAETRQYVTTCAACDEELNVQNAYITFNNGEYVGGPGGMPLDGSIKPEHLYGKALHFEFKFEGDGSFGFTVFSYEWKNITGKITITKTGDSVTASVSSSGVISYKARIIELENGWYAWEMNSADFIGDGVLQATEVGLIYHENQVVQGTVHIDGTSIKAVDSFIVTKEAVSTHYTDGEKVGGAGGMLLPVPVQISELEGKALSFEFKFESENGYFACTLCDSAREWANTIGLLKITKNGDTVTANNGLIVALEDGWYMWKFNRSLFAGDGIARAQVVDLIYNDGEVVQGDVFINWTSLKAVDAYEVSKEESATRYTTGEYVGGNNGTLLSDSVPVAYLEGKALRFEFKIEGDGSFGFTIFSREWKNMTGKITITKTGDTVTASINSNGVISDKSRIIELENGWYAWELNASDFIGDGLADAVDLGLIYHENQVVSGVVYIDWLSVNIVDAK